MAYLPPASAYDPNSPTASQGIGANYMAPATQNYQWKAVGDGVQYFANGAPVTREFFQAGVNNQGDYKTNVDDIENWVRSNSAQPTGGAGVSGGTDANTNLLNQQRAYQTQRLNEREAMYKGDIERQYGDQVNSVNTSKGQGEQNLNRTREKLNINKTNSLRDLAGNIRQQNQALQVRLGNGGAGDSSATKMGAYALQNLQNSNRNQILENVGQSNQDINIQWEQLQQNFANNMRGLDTWKQSQLNAIIDKFQTARDDIAAAQQLAQLDRTYQAAQNQVVQQAQVDTASLQNAGQNINANPIDQGNVNPNAGFDWGQLGATAVGAAGFGIPGAIAGYFLGKKKQ